MPLEPEFAPCGWPCPHWARMDEANINIVLICNCVKSQGASLSHCICTLPMMTCVVLPLHECSPAPHCSQEASRGVHVPRHAGELMYQITKLPNGPVKAGRRWGQRHPQGANLGSNGILKFLSKTDTMAATSPP